MKYKILIMLFALILLPFGGQGQTVLQPDANVSILNGSVLINQPGTYTITGNSTTTNNTIKIECREQGDVNLTIIDLNISSSTSNSPINIISGNVKLRLVGNNSLISEATEYSAHYAALHVAANTSLTITIDSNGGYLLAKSLGQSAAIGGNSADIHNRVYNIGEITINGGYIKAESKNRCAAIGSGSEGQSVSKITINGGYIIANALDMKYGTSVGAAGKDPWVTSSGGTITITGGTLIALNDNEIGAIGNKTTDVATKVIIYGGSVYFDPKISNVIPVNNNDKEVFLKTICGLKPNTKLAELEGVSHWPWETYVDTNGKLYLWLPENSKVSSIHAYDESVPEDNSERDQYYYNQSLIVKRNGELWNDHNIAFTVENNDTGKSIDCSDNDFYLVNGDYSLYADGKVIYKPINIAGKDLDYITENITLDYYTVTYHLNKGDNNSSIPKPKNYLKGEEIEVDKNVTPTREHYTFEGWGLKSDATEKVESIKNIQAETTLYAIWIAKKFTVDMFNKQQLTYKTDMNFDLSSLLSPNAETDCGAITFNINKVSSLPAGLNLEGSIIKGAPEAVTAKEIETYITATAANEYTISFKILFSVAKAKATIANIDISAEGYTYSGKAIEIAPPEVSGADSEKLDATLTYYTSYTNENINTKTTSANSGAAQEGGAPVYAGSYTVVASFAGNDNYNKADNQSATFDIKQKELTVTPVSNQIIYEGDKILYNATDAVNGEIPVFEGTLKVEDGKIIPEDNFKLKDSFSKNYSFKFTSDISATVHNGKASEAVATMKAEAGQNGWFTSNVTITPPADFKIELVPSTPVATLKSNDAHKETLVWDTEGAHTLSYTLHRQSRDGSYPHDLSLKLDKTPPTLRATVDNENYTLTFSDGNAGSGIDKLLVDDKEVSISDTDASYAGTAPAGVHKAKVFDKAGLSYEIEFTLTKKPDNPDPNPGPKPDPDPGPMPTPTRYDVTLTDTTGIIYTPAAGKYKVDAWGKFDFSIEVAKGYTMFSDPIVYVNNVKLPSKDNKGNYSINPVREDKVVKVTGIVSDLSTANEAINTPDRRITVIGKTIYIDVPDRAVFHLFDLTGSHKLSRQLHPGTNRIDVDSGSYIGRIDNEKEGKVIIVK